MTPDEELFYAQWHVLRALEREGRLALFLLACQRLNTVWQDLLDEHIREAQKIVRSVHQDAETCSMEELEAASEILRRIEEEGN